MLTTNKTHYIFIISRQYSTVLSIAVHFPTSLCLVHSVHSEVLHADAAGNECVSGVFGSGRHKKLGSGSSYCLYNSPLTVSAVGFDVNLT